METDLPTKRLPETADVVSGISFEARGKMNCHISSLALLVWLAAPDKLLTNIPATPKTWSTSSSLVATSSSMVCSRGRLQPSTRTCLKKLTPGDPTSLPPSSWTMSLPFTTLLQRCGPQLPDGPATSTSNSPC